MNQTVDSRKYYPTALALYITYFVLGIAASIMGQYKQDFAAMWGAASLADGSYDVSGVVAVIAAIGLGRLVAFPIAGPLSDRLGRRLSALIGCVLYAIFLLAITFGIFFFAKLLQKKTGLVLLNPILLTIALLIIFLKMTNISYETYNKGGHLIEFWLRPAVVALGVPLYLQLEMIKKQLLPILLSQLAGCIVGVISVVLIAKFMGASQEVILSLAPKSVTTPIAMEVTKAIGGIPSLTAAVVVAVGLLGAICGFKTMKIMRVGSPIAQGLSMGTAAHAVGTSTAMDISSKYGEYASLGLTLNGIFTALLTPTILRLLGVL